MNISNDIIKFNSIHDIAKYIINLEEKKGYQLWKNNKTRIKSYRFNK
jgi:hypothetical protein